MLTKLLHPGDAEFTASETWYPKGSASTPPRRAAGTSPNTSESRKTLQEDEEEKAALKKRIAELEAALERRVRETQESAYRDGENAGRNQGTAQVQPVLEQLARSLQELGNMRPKLRQEAESDLLKLALAIARKVLHRELSIDPDSIAGLIKVSIEKIRLQEIVRVRIHPQHQPLVQQILARLSMGVQIETYPDPKLQLGGVVVETTRGDFDSSVDLQLKEIERGLTDHLAGHK